MGSLITEGTSGWLAKNVSPASEVVEIVLYTANTVDATDTIAVDLSSWGMYTPLSIFGCKHTGDGSVIVTEAPTTTLSSSTLTITVPGGTDNDPRVYVIVGLGYELQWAALS